MSKIIRSIRATQVGILTDFGLKNPYVSEVKCTIARDIGTLEAEIIDITHSIKRFNITEGAYVLHAASRWFPEGSILLAVVDPGVGTERSALVIRSEKRTYIGPDNGILLPSARSDGKYRVFKIKAEATSQERFSETFHARDIYAWVINLILKGKRVEDIGEQTEDYVDMDIFKYEVREENIRGTVLFVDDFGNIITNIPCSEIKGRDKVNRYEVSTKAGTFGLTFVKSYGFVEPNELLLTTGSEGFLEVAVNRGSAHDVLRSDSGDEISLKRVDR